MTTVDEPTEVLFMVGDVKQLAIFLGHGLFVVHGPPQPLFPRG